MKILCFHGCHSSRVGLDSASTLAALSFHICVSIPEGSFFSSHLFFLCTPSSYNLPSTKNLDQILWREGVMQQINTLNKHVSGITTFYFLTLRDLLIKSCWLIAWVGVTLRKSLSILDLASHESILGQCLFCPLLNYQNKNRCILFQHQGSIAFLFRYRWHWKFWKSKTSSLI